MIDGYTEKLNGIMEELLNDNKELFNNAVCVNILYQTALTVLKNLRTAWEIYETVIFIIYGGIRTEI